MTIEDVRVETERTMPAMVQDDSKHQLIQPNALHQYTVTAADLPLSCPMPGMFLWNSQRLGEVPLLRRRIHAQTRRCGGLSFIIAI